ncbi:ATP synthase subunit I [Bradyrhizobium sp. dw_411]|uniref:ATP synthase subunit I n=1 Tax=Bradyrhizobium sp. dw_411 TaxID=2720082 RepID=UPI001BCB54C4|nr:ATP synthase subunit I [Bradyrhizobium sp. dw_411]
MTSLALNNLPNWATLLSLVAHLAAGIVVGVLYFRSLWWNARRFTTGGRVSTTIAVMIGRFVILGMILTLASLEGALPLLLMALGVVIARPVVMRGIREITP